MCFIICAVKNERGEECKKKRIILRMKLNYKFWDLEASSKQQQTMNSKNVFCEQPANKKKTRNTKK